MNVIYIVHRDAKKLFRYPEVVVFLVMIFVLGNMWGFVESYLFVFLKDDLDAPNYLLGKQVTGNASHVYKGLIKLCTASQV